MANPPRIFKANLQIADLNRNYYNDHLLTIAQHSSETDERMMVRVLAFALNANDNLNFGPGLSAAKTADIWDKDHNENVSLWISVGLPDEKLVRFACSKATHVIVYSYGGNPASIWWKKNNFSALSNLKVFNLAIEETALLASMAVRGMKLNFTIQENEVMVGNETDSLTLNLQIWK